MVRQVGESDRGHSTIGCLRYFLGVFMTPPAPNGGWQPSNNYLAQVTHVLGGALIILAAHLQGYSPWWVFLGVAVGTGLKEFIGDTFIWERDSFYGDFTDWLHYLIGSSLAILTLYYFWPGIIAGSLTILLMALSDASRGIYPYD